MTLPEALELFKLPRNVGQMPDGHDIRVAIGRFGPYVQYGAKKFVSIKDDDPYTVELPRALELIRAKEVLDANRIILDFPDAGIQVLNGRYGPYITDRVKNAKIPKDREPKTLTLDECKELIAAAPERGKGRFGRFAKKTAAPAAGAAAPATVEKAESRHAARPRAAKTTAPATPRRQRSREGAGENRGEITSEGGRPEEESGSEEDAEEIVMPAPAPDVAAVLSYLRGLQDRICAAIEAADGRARFRADAGSAPKAAAGAAASCARRGVRAGRRRFFRRHAARSCRRRRVAQRPELAGRAWTALGVSLVLHPRNPYVPTTHCNVRFFCAHATATRSRGGSAAASISRRTIRSTRTSLHWHRTARRLCAPFGDDVLRALQATGATTISSSSIATRRAASAACSSTISTSAASSAASRISAAVGDRFPRRVSADRRAPPRDAVRRARARVPAVPARALCRIQSRLRPRHAVRPADRGGRTESILMSLPPLVRWEYDWHPQPGSPKRALRRLSAAARLAARVKLSKLFSLANSRIATLHARVYMRAARASKFFPTRARASKRRCYAIEFTTREE